MNFSVPFIIINKPNRIKFEKLPEDILEKLKTILEF